ncbi:cell division protein ZipA [Amphritea atlantica]|uniref:Cell division protein ZipA n=1 Tax=Amphritea atlantica TaxID=355243 RepID=A0A1H9L6L5_9GAMM|nr:cell division protein ZipA C-terminal FtsZ-binding domain-containing protein [Amphritea atlantica]SER07000.1 cell division protein ZipA [Amphritea atlantica]
MELGLREWLIIGGAIVVLLIVLDGWRRMRGGGNRLKMKIDKSFNDIPDVPEETFNPELPGGGARVVGRASDSAADTRREPVFGNAELGNEGLGNEELELSIPRAARSAAEQEKTEARKPLSHNKPVQNPVSSSPATEPSATPGRFAKPGWMKKSAQERSEHISPTFSEDEHDPLFASSDSFPPHHDGPSFDDMDEGISAVRVVRTPKPSEKDNEHPADKPPYTSPQDDAVDEDIPVVKHIVTQQERDADAKTGSASGEATAYSPAEPESFRPEHLVPDNHESETEELAYQESEYFEDDSPDATRFEKGSIDSENRESERAEIESSEFESPEFESSELESSEPEIAQPENVELFPADESDREAVPATSQRRASYSAEDDDLIDSLPEGFRTGPVAENDDDDDENEFDYTRPVSELMRPVREENSQLQQTAMDLPERQESIFSLIDEPAVESEPPFEKSGLARVKAALKPKPAPQPERFSAIDDEPEEIADGFSDDQPSAMAADKTAAKPANTADNPDSSIGIKGQSLQKIPEADKVLVISVVAAEGQDGFSGRSLLQILLACGMRYGDMKIFHRYEDGLDKGAIQFSMTNALEPGYFDIDTMDSMETRGVTFFMSMEEPRDVMNAYECMLATAIAVAKNLHGVLLDENRSTMRDQTKEHYRERIRKFEMRKLKKTTSA